MTNPNTGRFNWHELMASDAVGAAKFYTELLGWKVQEMPTPAGPYRILTQGDVGVGAVMQAPPGVPSHWLVYVGSEDPDTTVKMIAELGGKIMVPPETVPGMVRFSIAQDPQGAAFGVLKGLGPKANDPPYDGPPRPGTFVWDELLTKDIDASAKFYGKIFGWSGKLGEGPMKYWHWTNAGKEIGGMMTLMMPNVPPHWLGYVAVSDVDGVTKKAETLGGKVMMPAMEIEKVGKFSIVKDPTGAVFALFRSARV